MSLLQEEKTNIDYPLISDPKNEEDPIYKALVDNFGTEPAPKNTLVVRGSLFRRVRTFISDSKQIAFVTWLENHKVYEETVIEKPSFWARLKEMFKNAFSNINKSVPTEPEPEIIQEIIIETITETKTEEPEPEIIAELVPEEIPEFIIPSHNTTVTGMVVSSIELIAKPKEKKPAKKKVTKKKVAKTTKKVAPRKKKSKFDPADIRI